MHQVSNYNFRLSNYLVFQLVQRWK